MSVDQLPGEQLPRSAPCLEGRTHHEPQDQVEFVGGSSTRDLLVIRIVCRYCRASAFLMETGANLVWRGRTP
jgi:hypothetical protein